jgi:hypothetical protein
MRAYELLTEDELKEYRLDTRQKLGLSATLPWKIAENPKYLKSWNKAVKTRDMLAAATFTQNVLEPILRRSGYAKDPSLISDAHDYFFHALINYSGEREEFIQRLNSRIQDACKSIQAKRAQEPSRISKAIAPIKQAITSHLPKKSIENPPKPSYA